MLARVHATSQLVRVSQAEYNEAKTHLLFSFKIAVYLYLLSFF